MKLNPLTLLIGELNYSKKNLSVTSANLCPVTTKHGLTCGRHHSQI